MESLTISAAYSGFPGLALGGYTAGLMAAAAGRALEVTLRQAVRTGEPLQLDADTDGIRLLGEGELLADGVAREPEVDVVDHPSMDEAAEGTRRYPRPDEHPQPTCFCCGPARAPGEGLRVHASPVTGHPRSLVVGRWEPHPAFADATGVVPVEVVWAALDCPAIWAVWHATGEDTLTGRITTIVKGKVSVGSPYVVTGWMTGSEGRRRYGAAALLDEDGHVVARSTQTCVVIDAARLPT